jgi:hypothetical protein
MRNWIASLKSFTVNAIVLMSDYTPQGVDLTTTEANQTRLKIECNTILANYGKVYNSMLAGSVTKSITALISKFPLSKSRPSPLR